MEEQFSGQVMGSHGFKPQALPLLPYKTPYIITLLTSHSVPLVRISSQSLLGTGLQAMPARTSNFMGRSLEMASQLQSEKMEQFYDFPTYFRTISSGAQFPRLNWS